MKKKWLYLEPYVFYWQNKREGLVYNSLNFSSFAFEYSVFLWKLIRQLDELKNMYCVEVSQEDLSDSTVKQFVTDLKKTSSGGILEFSGNKYKPVFLPPKLKILRISNDKIEAEIKSFLHEITFYVNGQCDHNCSFCSDCYKQVLFCTKNKDELSFFNIINIVNSIGDYHLKVVNILGGNILKYKQLPSLISILNDFSFIKFYNINYLNLANYDFIKKILNNKNNKLRILINFPFYGISTDILSFIKDFPNLEWLFLVTSLNDFQFSIKFIEGNRIKNYEIKPIFISTNISFFKDYVFLNQSDILGTKLNRRQIFQKQVINTNDFGKLIIFSDGKAYANINHSNIGDITTPVGQILQTEITKGVSWKRTRLNLEPCKSCLFRFLCPSPSNYEKVINKMNLCTL